MCNKWDDTTSVSWFPAFTFSKMAYRKDLVCSITVRNNGLNPLVPCLRRTPAFVFFLFPTESLCKILPHKYPQKNVLLQKLVLRHSRKLVLNSDNIKDILRVQKSRKKEENKITKPVIFAKDQKMKFLLALFLSSTS